MDLKLGDNGAKFDKMTAAGIQVCGREDNALIAQGTRHAARPVVAWWIFAKKPE